MPYLTYILDNYPTFPDVVVFMHPHKTGMPQAWHNDARGHNAVHMLEDLQLKTVVERGYVKGVKWCAEGYLRVAVLWGVAAFHFALCVQEC